MSTYHIIHATCQVTCTNKIISEFLVAGSKHGFVYCLEKEIDVFTSINIDTAIKMKCNAFEDPNYINNVEIKEIIQVKYKDTYFIFNIQPIGLSTTDITISPTRYLWKQSFIGHMYDIDLNRYFRLLFAVCKDFPIISFHVEVW